MNPARDPKQFYPVRHQDALRRYRGGTQETRSRHPGDTQEAPRMHPAATQEAQEAPGDTQDTRRVCEIKSHYMLLSKVVRPTVLHARQVPHIATKMTERGAPTEPALTPPSL